MTLAKAHAMGREERKSWKRGPECRCHPVTALLQSALASLTPSPLEAVSKRLAILENRIV